MCRVCTPRSDNQHQPNNKLTFSEARRITLDLVDGLWKGQDTIEMKNVHEITLTVSSH